MGKYVCISISLWIEYIQEITQRSDIEKMKANAIEILFIFSCSLKLVKLF